MPLTSPASRVRSIGPSKGFGGSRSTGGASGPPTSPVPDLWMEADGTLYQDTGTSTPATANTDPVGHWIDTGTLAFGVTQATGGTRPLLLSDSGFKSKPAVQFSSTQYLDNAAAALMNSRTKGTVIVAFQSDTGSPPGGAVFSTTQDQLGILSDGRVALNTAAAEYGTMAPGAKGAMLSLMGGQIMRLVYDGTLSGNANRLKLFRNGIQETLTFTGTISATSYAGGSSLFIGREAAGAGWSLKLMAVVFFRAAAILDTAWDTYLADKYFTTTTSQLVVQGDSMAVGSPTQTANPWPKRVTDSKGWVTVSNNSTVGFTLQSGSAAPNFDKRNDWYSHQPYIVALGSNDLAVNHASLATLQGYFNTLKTKLTDARYPIFAFTIPMAGANIAGADETTRAAYNSWLAGLSGITVIDVATALGDPTGAGDANFEGDDLHPSDAGHTVITNTVLAAFTAAGY